MPNNEMDLSVHFAARRSFRGVGERKDMTYEQGTAMENGLRTREVAEKLVAKLRADPVRYSGVKLYYDHGESAKAGVCQPTSYMGRRYGADATLAGLDIVLVKNRKVLVAIEIEESDVRPKVVLGDVFGLILADRVRIGGRSYLVDGTVLIVAVTVGPRGSRRAKYLRLERHLRKYLLQLNQAAGRQRVKKIRIVPVEPRDLVTRIERLIRLEAGKQTSAV